MSRQLESIEDLEQNPEAFGFCTFQQFVKNREKWTGRKDEEIAGVDRGLQLGCTQRYFIECLGSGRVRLDSLEEGERIAKDQGLDFYSDYVVKPQLRHDPMLRQGYYNEVTFYPKVRRVAR